LSLQRSQKAILHKKQSAISCNAHNYFHKIEHGPKQTIRTDLFVSNIQKEMQFDSYKENKENSQQQSIKLKGVTKQIPSISSRDNHYFKSNSMSLNIQDQEYFSAVKKFKGKVQVMINMSTRLLESLIGTEPTFSLSHTNTSSNCLQSSTVNQSMPFFLY